MRPDLRLVVDGGVDIRPVACPVACPVAAEITRAGRLMEQAMAAGQRDLAVVWMNTMYGLIRVRSGAANGFDIHTGGGHA